MYQAYTPGAHGTWAFISWEAETRGRRFIFVHRGPAFGLTSPYLADGQSTGGPGDEEDTEPEALLG